MADNWNEQELQALFHKHLPVQQMPKDFAEQLKKQVLAEVAATLGPEPVKSAATEEVRERPLLADAPGRTVQPKRPRSVANPTPLSWSEWFRERLQFAPMATTVGALLLLFALIVWGDHLRLPEMQTARSVNGPTTLGGATPTRTVGVADTSSASATALAATPLPEGQAVAVVITDTPTPLLSSTTVDEPTMEESAMAAPTAANETEVAAVITVVSTPDEETPATVAVEEEAPTAITGGITAEATNASPVPSSTRTPIVQETPRADATATRIASRTPTPTDVPGLLIPSPTPSRSASATPTTSAIQRNGTATATPESTRRPTVVATLTPLGLPNVVTLTATKLPTMNPVLAATLTPFEPTNTPTPLPTATAIVTRAPTATNIAFVPWKSPTPTVTATPEVILVPTATDEPTTTTILLPTATATPNDRVLPTATTPLVVEATDTVAPAATALRPTATRTPLPTETDTPLPTPTNTLLPTATPTNTPWPTATNTMPPPPTATPTNTMPPPPTATPTNTPVVNRSPMIIATPVEVIEDSQRTFSLLDAVTDEDGQPLRIVNVLSASHGEVRWLDGSDMVTYVPAPNYNGEDSFEFVVTDSWVTVRGVILIKVLPINDIPEIRGPGDLFATEASEFSYQIEVVDPDHNVADLSFRVVDGPGWLWLEPTTGKLSGTPGSADVGTSRLWVEVTDPAGGAITKEFIMNVAAGLPPNEPTPTDMQDDIVAASPALTETQAISSTDGTQ
ncbi:MAG: cadherin-like domain-containing protein [Caldilineaceae bacterium]|nr:cadherin-like domain-containing protein [Caldilineaceae bacterium]